LKKWRAITVALLVIGYAGYYLCRSDLSVATPLLIAELGRRGFAPNVARLQMGTIASLGVFAYAIGKFPSGWRNFLFGMAGAIQFTILFGLGGGIPIFTSRWFS